MAADIVRSKEAINGNGHRYDMIKQSMGMAGESYDQK